MILTKDIIRFLKENAYAVKGGEYWFLSDFPSDQMPERLEIPMNKRAWEQLKEVSK